MVYFDLFKLKIKKQDGKIYQYLSFMPINHKVRCKNWLYYPNNCCNFWHTVL